VSFAAITLCVASQRAFIVVGVDFAMDSVRKLLDTYSTGDNFDEGKSKGTVAPALFSFN
jgi:hypothetical protein